MDAKNNITLGGGRLFHLFQKENLYILQQRCVIEVLCHVRTDP